ncbi:Proliferation-associated protein 2G4 [Entamoeba marina]
MSTIHKPTKKNMSLDKKIAAATKKQQKKEEAEQEQQQEFDDDEQDLTTADDPRVIKRYEQAAKITNEALALAISLCVEKALVVDICQTVDNFITEEAKKIFKGEYSYECGIAFPCSISLNNCCGYYCPLKDDKTTLKKGDMAKIELAAHISGFVAEACKTIVIGEEPTGDKARVIEAGYVALQEIINKLQPKVSTGEIADSVKEICDKYEVKAFENIVSRNMERYMIDGNKFILNVPSKQAADNMTIDLHDVWNLDVIMTTGSGKPSERDVRTTIYKRNVDETYILKMRTSVQIFREVNNKYPTFPFSLRMLENESKAKMGIVEMAKHDLVDPYTVVFEKEGFVSQFKATVIVTDKGPLVLTPIEQPSFLKKE